MCISIANSAHTRTEKFTPATTDNGTIRLALGIQYDGSAYHGWQRQQEVPSVQAFLERALSTVANEAITVYCAGRTDAGVHAIGQVVHFNTMAQRSNVAWVFGVNSNLPPDIVVHWAIPVVNDFHARFSAIARRYLYVIYNCCWRPALFSRGLNHQCHQLDVPSMARAAQCLLGEHDFTSFRSSHCQSRSPWRRIYSLHVTRYGRYVTINIKANSFVYHMVRNIVGSLLEVGYGNRPESWCAELLACRDRTQAGATAKSNGLYLVGVDYPAYFSLPTSSSELLFLVN